LDRFEKGRGTDSGRQIDCLFAGACRSVRCLEWILKNRTSVGGSRPEIIPYLIKAVDGHYGGSGGIFGGPIHLLSRLAPEALRKYFPERKAPTWAIQTFAAFRLGQFGTNALEAVPHLVKLLERPAPPGVDKGRVVQALGWIGPGAKEAVPTLVDALIKEQQPFLKAWIAYSLMEIGTVPTKAIPALESLKGEVGHIAGSATVAIRMANHESKSLEAIRAAVKNQTNSALRAYTARSLAFAPNLDPVTAGLLVSQLHDSNSSVRQGAALALVGKVAVADQKQVIDVLIEGLRPGEFSIPCAQALSNIGKDAQRALPAIRAALVDPSVGGPVLHRALTDAIRVIEADSEAAKPKNSSE
jgi:HEAT repeat protein